MLELRTLDAEIRLQILRIKEQSIIEINQWTRFSLLTLYCEKDEDFSEKRSLGYPTDNRKVREVFKFP